MKKLSFVAVVLPLLVASGCNSNDPKAKMRRATREYTDAATLLASVKDANSFEAAKPQLRKHFAWVRVQNRDAKANSDKGKNVSQDYANKSMKEYEALSKEPEFKELMEALTRYASELLRAMMAVPGFQQFQTEEMAKS